MPTLRPKPCPTPTDGGSCEVRRETPRDFATGREVLKLDLSTDNQQAAWLALERLLRIARQDTGQARRVADFLLAWHNAEENGGWNPVDLWSVDAAIADDMLSVLSLVRESHRYPDDLGFRDEIATVWRLWRGGQTSAKAPASDNP